MKRVLKWLFILTAGFLSLVLLGVLVIQVYKKEILVSINETLKGMVNGDVNIGDYNITILHDFPNISITLKDIYLHGPAFETYHRPFLKATRVDINVEALRLLQKDISIKSVDIHHGEVFVFRTHTGYTNMKVFKTNKTANAEEKASGGVLDLKQINLRDVHVMYEDSLKQKSIGIRFLKTENSITLGDSATAIHIVGNMTFDKLTLNTAKGSMLKNKNVQADLTLELDKHQNLLIKNSLLKFDKSTVKLSGLFLLANPGSFELHISSDQMDHGEGLTIVADSLAKKLSKYLVEKPIALSIDLKGVIQPGVKPQIDVRFSFQNSKVTAGKIEMEKMTMNGAFINHVEHTLPNDDQNSQVHIEKMKGLVNNLPVEAEVTLTDLRDPLLDLKAVFDVDLKNLNIHLDTTKFKMMGGHFNSTFTYSGKLKEYLDENRTSYEGKLSGQAKITDGKMTLLTKKTTLDKLDAVFVFNENQFEAKSLSVAMNKSRISVNGTMTDFIPFFTNPKTTGKVKMNIESPRLDISGLLQPRKVEKTKKAKAASKKRIADMADRLNDELEFDVNFNIKEFINKSFKANSVKGRLILANNTFALKKATMDFGGGNVEMGMEVSNLQRPINPLHVKATMRNVRIKDFFYAFDNFKQSTFRHEQVDGKLSLNIDLTAEVNDKLEFLMPHLVGKADFVIEDGRLRDFEPMQRLSNFLLKGRDFSDVSFGEISSQIKMRGTVMDVQRMEVESTVVTLFIEGQYDLKDSTNLSIQVPLNNLKKRDQNIPPENIGTDSKVGASVFLRVRPDKNGKTSIAYDPFKKFRKKKKTGTGS